MPDEILDRDFALAHALLRFGLGVDLFVHGLARLPQLGVFVGHMQQTMAKTCLPLALVTTTAYVIPFVEFAIGALLILGLFLRLALVCGSLLMIVLMFGICLTQNWTVAAEQLIYIFVFAALLANARRDRYSIDGWRSR